jgi:excisionase family DNA binding protein
VIENLRGVYLDIEEARYLAEVLEHAARIGNPSPRVADLIARLRKVVDTANEPASGRDNGRDPGNYRAYDLCTCAEAAGILACSTANVRYLRSKGRLPAHRVGGRWLYPVRAVERLAESKRRAG